MQPNVPKITQTFRAGLRERPPGRIRNRETRQQAPALMEGASIPPAKMQQPDTSDPQFFKAQAIIHTLDFHHGKVSAHSLDHMHLDPAENIRIFMESAMQRLTTTSLLRCSIRSAFASPGTWSSSAAASCPCRVHDIRQGRAARAEWELEHPRHQVRRRRPDEELEGPWCATAWRR
jgi:hypothetical protein